MKPVDVPKTTRFGSNAEIAMTLTLPLTLEIGLDAALQVRAPAMVRQRFFPPIYIRFESAGSITYCATKRKFELGSVIPAVAVLNPVPPAVDLINDRLVNSPNTMFGSLGSMATAPPSPPSRRIQFSGPVESEPRFVPLSWAPAM